MSAYFFMISEVHYSVFRYNICFEKYMDLTPRSISGTKPKVIESMNRIKRRSKKN